MADGMYILSDDERRKYAKVVSKAWSDNDFAERYAREPHAVLEEFGIDFPKNVLAPLLPAPPAADLTMEQLEAVAAAAEATAGTLGTYGSLTGCAGTLGSYGSA